MTSTDDPMPLLSERTLRTYAADWALFTDWCAVTGNYGLPADPGTVVAFLADCPAAPKTHRGRVAAIDHQHTAAGHPPPGRSATVLAALGRPTGAPHQPSPETVTAVKAALRALPSHGWTQGMFGRRDRCLLVLSQVAGVPYKHLATLTAGDISLAGGTATITTANHGWSIAPVDDPVTCGPCAVVRWLRVLDLAVTTIGTAVIADAVDKADPLTGDSPHLCRSTRPLDGATLSAAVLAPINQWGALPFPLPRLSPHSQSRRARDLLAGDLGAHRQLPVPADDPTEQPPVNPATVAAGGYDRAAWQRAWTKRRAELDQLAGVGDVLTDIDQRVADLQGRVTALLNSAI